MFLEAYKKASSVIVKKPVMLWGLSLLSSLISFFAGIMFLGIPALGMAISFVITCGMSKVYIDGLYGKQVNSDQLFAGFDRNFLRRAGGMAWMILWVVIWCLIPIAGPIIAIVKAYSYKFVPYILMTKPEVTATQALKLSMQMTQGKKGQMFLADLCFFGGYFILTLLLGLFSAIPFIGILFRLISAIVIIAFALFSGIFSGLYGAAFYVDAETPAQAPVEEVPFETAE